jgi:oligoendopeptidase F
LYAIYREQGPAFLPAYDELLSSTGQGTSAELAARFGIDIRDRGFWESSMRIIEARIDRYLAL